VLERFRRKAKAERSASGQPILRHQAADREFTPAPAPDGAARESLERHLERHLGPMSSVWHEIVSDLVHLDVYMWRPTAERPMFTFVTGGMSDLPMTVPRAAVAAGTRDRAELMVCLPPSWPVPTDDHAISPWTDEDAYFPVRSLKHLARLPHDYGTWLGFGHTIPNGDPPAQLSTATEMCGWMLLPPMTVPADFRELHVPGVGDIEIFGIVALHADEMTHKLANGAESLFDGFDRHEVNELLDVERGSSLT